MRKAKKKLHPMPKLGWKDMALYWSGMLLSGIGAVITFVYPILVRDDIAFSDPSVVATNSKLGSIQCFWIILWFIAVICWIAVPYRKRYPVFGRTDIKYGPPAYPRVFPLLMKDKPRYWVSAKKMASTKKWLQIGAWIMAVWLLIGIWTFPNSIYHRADLRRNGTISVMDGSNRETQLYRFGDVEAVEFMINHSRRRGSTARRWYITVVISTKDGERFSYRNSEFHGDWLETLESMQALKYQYSDRVTVKGEEDLEKVVSYYDLNEYEKFLLYQLFQ